MKPTDGGIGDRRGGGAIERVRNVHARHVVAVRPDVLDVVLREGDEVVGRRRIR